MAPGLRAPRGGWPPGGRARAGHADALVDPAGGPAAGHGPARGSGTTPTRRSAMKVLAILGRSIWALPVLALTGAVVLAGVRFPTPATPAVPPEAVEVPAPGTVPVSYTHLRAHETGRNL